MVAIGGLLLGAAVGTWHLGEAYLGAWLGWPRPESLKPFFETLARWTGPAEIAALRVEDEVVGYIAAITRATRDDPAVLLGCSPRASVMLLLTSRVLAALRGRAYLIPDDVKQMAAPTLRHRMVLRPEADIEGLTADDIIARALAAVPVPR